MKYKQSVLFLHFHIPRCKRAVLSPYHTGDLRSQFHRRERSEAERLAACHIIGTD